MPTVLPHSFLFRYAFPVPRLDELPDKWPDSCRLVSPSRLDAPQPFADVRVAWNPRGLLVGMQVFGKHTRPACNKMRPAESDGLQIWVDTRDTQSIHRASRYCHHFCFLPAGGGASAQQPYASELPIARARETHRLAMMPALSVTAGPTGDGYRLDAWVPAESLTGFDPEHSPRLGFYYCVRDTDLGEQFLSVGREFPFDSDPSLWSTLELVG